MYHFLQGRLIFLRLILLFAVLLVISAGILTLYALGHPAQTDENGPNNLENLWKKQLFFALIGLFAFWAVNLLNYRRLGALSYWMYAGVLLLLITLLFSKYLYRLPFAPPINGTFRWLKISFGSFELPRLQPSELFKIVYLLALSWYLRYRSNYRHFQALIGPFVLTLLPMGLILLEPDLGTVMLIMPILFIMLFIAGAKVKHLVIILLLAVLVSPVMWHSIKGYQRMRISALLLQNAKIRQLTTDHPFISRLLVGKPKFSENDWQMGAGYQLIRSKYAIASGGPTGYGFRQGPFIKYDFLPERENDFIFAIVSHQWGFWGCIGLFALYGVIIICGLEIAWQNNDPFGRLLAVGISAMFIVEILVNIGMTIGLMPITGLTLPFVSYGGSSLLRCMVAVGILNNIGRCKPFGISRSSTISERRLK